MDLRSFDVLIKMLHELIKIWIWRGVDIQMRDFFCFQLSIANHTIPIAGYKPIQGIADHAKVVEFVENMFWLFGIGDGGIEIMDVVALAVDLESDSTSLVSNFIEVAVIFNPENQFFNRSAGAFGR